VIGEFLILYDNILAGVGIHLISLLLTIIFIIFGNLSSEVKNILQSLMLLPLLRIVNLSVPRLFNDVYLQYLLICGIILIPIYSIIKNQQIFSKKLETNYERFYHYTFITILVWIIIVMFEQYENIISNIQTNSPENIYAGAQFVSIFLTISLSIVLMTLDTKYWNKYVSNTFGMYVKSLLLTFMVIVIYNIVMALQ
jgi:hypothetical protein